LLGEQESGDVRSLAAMADKLWAIYKQQAASLLVRDLLTAK
jgi:hypothetical protein